MEVELKLALDPADVKRFRRAAALSRAKPRVLRMDGVYLDTETCELARHGMALRLRTDGERWMQCLKAGHSGAGGLHARGEWEYEQEQRVMDLARFRETPLADLKDAATLHQRLHGAFRVTFDRTTWELKPRKGTRLEVALDTGHVSGAEGTEPICEVEIECLEGDARAAFDLADSLMETVTLRPSIVTKAQRGYRLYRGEPMKPVKAVASQVRAGTTPLTAARAIVSASLEQLQANEEGLLASDDPEFVHQARVAMRRMRSALRMFAKPIGRSRADAWRGSLGRATRSLGAARDWDVFMTETLPALPAAPQVMERARRQQSRARQRARKAIRSRPYAQAILRISRWLSAKEKPRDDGKLDAFAAKRLDKRHARLVADLGKLAHASVEERHRTRIDAKRLRYVVEGLAPALDAGKAKRYSRMLSRLQDALGRANDAVTGQALLERLDPPAGLAAFAHDWLAARIADETKDLAALAHDITHFKPFWRHA